MKLLAAGSIVVLGAALGAVPSSGAGEAEPPAPGTCSKAELKRLKKLGDNFADACYLPGQELGRVGGSQAELVDEDDVASENMQLIAESPLAGPFDEESVGSDLAFQGDYAYAGNYDGLTVLDISDPTSPEQVAQLDCVGPQNDISVYDDVLIMSVDSVRSDDSCSSTAGDATDDDSWEGLRVVDISDPSEPEVVANVNTACGSHTHTLAPSKNGANLFVYVSSYGPTEQAVNCQPPHDAISIVKVPMTSPEDAELQSTPVLFPSGGLGEGGDNGQRPTSGCHDITAYPAKDIAAGACMGDGILMDISRRAKPVVTERVRDTANFTFWHSATFNNDATKVVFTDELGGGGAATCNPSVGLKRGANGIYKIVRGELRFKSYYKIPRTNGATENCVSHNGSLLPVEGRDIMVQAWYQGGISLFEFTKAGQPKELAYFDRGAISPTTLQTGGFWSVYYYNGYVYGNDITRGFEVFELDAEDLDFADEAAEVEMSEFNPQSQPSYNG